MELYEKQTEGSYKKEEHEDFLSIYKGIVGRKGAVHVAFGEPMVTGIDSADAMALAVDRQIINNYYLHPTNFLAYEKLHGMNTVVSSWKEGMDCDWLKITREFNHRMEAIPGEYRDIVLAMYANPVVQKINLTSSC